MSATSSIVGIDLGTSTSEIALLRDGKPWVIPDRQGRQIMPSVVGVAEDGQVLVGQAAADQALIRPDDTVLEIKRLMGTDRPLTLGGRRWLPTELSAEIIRSLVQRASEYLGEPVKRAVITVPAYFSDLQRQATIEAGRLAGLQVERIINEPTAAALDYGMDHLNDCQNLLVFDFGGGTLDVTVLELFDGVLEVKASAGDNQLGGKDFDHLLVDHLLDCFSQQHQSDLSEDPRAMMRLKEAAENSKIRLSEETECRIVLPFLAEVKGEPVGLEATLTRVQFEAMIAEPVRSTGAPVKKALQDAGLKATELDLILLVGGSTRIPCVRRFLMELLGQEPKALVDPDLAVARGAAIQAGIIAGTLDQAQDVLITDVCPYTLGIETLGEIGGMPSTDVLSVIIPRNTTIPVARTGRYTTVSDDQTEVEIKVYQGDYQQASRNNSLGEFTLSGLPPAPAFTEKVDVSFAYDVNGLLQVTASVVSTGDKADIQINLTGKDQAETEIQLERWQDMPGARKHRRLLLKAEALLAENRAGSAAFDLDGLIKDIKRGLVSGLPAEELDALRNSLNDLVYTLEESGTAHD